MESALLRPIDLIVILVFLAVCVVIGFYCSRRNKSAESYFLAGRSMPGWVVGFSLMATLISSMTFMAAPGFAYAKDWRYMPSSLMFICAIMLGMFIFMPVFRRSNMTSAYEYLEKRFGIWARYYAAVGYILMQIARLGLVMYTVSLAVHVMLGPKLGATITMEWVIILLGIAVAAYTIAGGLEAVIWTDLIQGLALMIGGLICLPIVIMNIPGGLGEIFSVAHTEGKLMPAELFEFSFNKETVWMLLMPAILNALWCTEQTTVQRYIAPKTTKEAKKAMLVSFVTVIPVWVYFAFIGTAIFVFYKFNPNPLIDEVAKEPEKVLPFFVLTEVPTGLAGFVVAGLIAAATSSLDSSINACASTVTNDIFKITDKKSDNPSYGLKWGRWASVFFGIIMIVFALMIHWGRTKTIQDLQSIMTQVLTAGIFALFMLGLLTRTIGNKAAITATICTVFTACIWLFFDSSYGQEKFSIIANYLPNKFWFGSLLNLELFSIAIIFNTIFKWKNSKNITNLSIMSIREDAKLESKPATYISK
ncbi:sodium:solute symporter family transporter [Poriferisphaera sp. WC338]|uniref:sodium:solute symporter family transporter n=1 Tax=Poriferisphaera sp. WC338 TaxID=3425129 RepID=UPI003D8151DA